MPGNLPLFPTDENRDTLESFLNLQREIESVLLRQTKTYEDIGHISKDLEASAKKRLEREKKLLNENVNDIGILQRKLLDSFEITSDVQRREFLFATNAIEERMLFRRKEMELIREIETIEREMAERKFKEDTKWGVFISKISKDVFGIKIKEYEMTKSIAEELQKYPNTMRGGAVVLASVITILAGAYELFKKFDIAAWNFRKAMGLTRDDAKEFRKIAENLAIDFAQIVITVDGAYKSVLALGKEMGSIYTISSDLIKTTSIISAQLGVSEEATAGFMHNMAAISKSTMQSQQDLVYIAADMSKAAGVPLDVVMKDVSSRTTQTLTMMSRIPNVVLRTAIEARRLNTTMNEMARASRSILDFSENVNAEMDASVLLGRAVNLQRARELAYRRDLEGSTKEIIRLTKQMNFENLDVFQQEAFARATGHSVDELLRMVTAERQWEAARRDPNLKGKVEAYEKLRKSNEEIAKARGKDLQVMLQQKANQERIVAIQNKWNQIMMKIQGPLLKFVDKFLEIIPPAIEFGTLLIKFSLNVYAIYKTLSGIGILIAKIGKSIKDIGVGFRSSFIWKFGDYIKSIGSSIAKWWHSLSSLSIFSKVGSWLNPISEIFKTIGNSFKGFKWILTLFKSVGKFTIVLNVVFAIWNVIKSIISGIKDIASGSVWSGLRKIVLGSLAGILEGFLGFIIDIPILILKGLGTVGVGWAKAAGEWADSMWTALKDWFGFSPSVIGLLIVKGISSIGTMLFDAITSPFRNAFRWIADNIPLIGKLMGKLGGSSVETKATTSYIPAVTVSPKETILNPTAKETTTQRENVGNAITKHNLDDLYDITKELVDLLKSGKITSPVYLDSQLLSSQIDRNTQFRRGYGVNVV